MSAALAIDPGLHTHARVPCRPSFRVARPPTSAVLAIDPTPSDATRGRMSELRAEHLQKRYKSRMVVQDVSLDVKSGEVVGLLGPNGAGKTTCFYMIVGLMPRWRRIFLDHESHPYADTSARPPRLWPTCRRRHRSFANSPWRRTSRRCSSSHQRPGRPEEQLEGLLHDLHITHLRDNPAVSLSGGERRRVEIARALATTRASSCSTSRSPASTPSPCWTSRRSSASSRSATSAC